MALDPITAVVDIGTTIIDKIFPDADAAAKAKLSLLELNQKGHLAEVQAKVEALTTEMSGNFLQRSWRPILMLSIVAIVVNNYILVPYLSAFGAPVVLLDLPDNLWNLMTLGVGGYIVGRSGEKIARTVRGEKK